MPGTEYYCPDCGETRMIPERPSDAPKTVRLGCDCGYIKRHIQTGVSRGRAGGGCETPLNDDATN
jgi:DNA-directed RNA polymerase subunit RPC12/RpoP